MSPIDLRGDKAGSSRTASGRRRIRALMPRDTKPPLARDATRRPSTGEASCSRQKRQMESCRASGTRPESQHLRYYRAGPLVPCWRSSSSWEVQSPDSSGTSKEKRQKKKKKSTPATKTTTTTGDAERPCRNLLLFSNIPPLVDTLFPRGGTETQWYASPSSRLLHVPHPPTQGVHGVFLPPCLIQEAKLNMLPCHRRALSFRAAAASLRQRHARTTCTNTRALLELCLRKNRELVWCLVCVEWPPNLFDAPDQQCIV